MELLRVSEVSKRERKEWILDGISFAQEAFRKIAIAGESGSGKTTLLKIIAGLAQGDGGTVLFGGERVKGLHEKLMPGHPGIAYLSQHFELHNNYRVEDLLSYQNNLSEEESQSLYEVCRIAHLLKRKTDQLSGGERQRIALAKLLARHPRLLLLDEPFSNLDPGHTEILRSVIRDVGERLRITCLLVSHDPADLLPWADEILVMRAGKIVQRGSPETIYRRPADEYTAGLFGKYSLLGKAAGTALSGTWNGDVAKGKRMLMRPEDFRIVPDGGEGEGGVVSGIVDRVSYHGSYYEIEVLLPGGRVTVRAGGVPPRGGLPVKGEPVCLSSDAAESWYL
jgi:ABC-type sugar transport system ATPase subunit